MRQRQIVASVQFAATTTAIPDVAVLDLDLLLPAVNLTATATSVLGAVPCFFFVFCEVH
ncbi:hypothetical protein PR003_g26244 [Phytophthora rubi]|uniref:Uncharacterized protein n=1 Tax=Phytophthora rubi TaxID=129364 RepID=A0A6A4CC26_9STRA|nr:hypothetical protein PR001_g25709 [Phytophthora rubi]KAE8977170.1 hypothetical protein PR002_g25091 [Phytophthora rubi]KAE9286697.1 hypothetical protein PR003_g26244 [Phytophthora rubi]